MDLKEWWVTNGKLPQNEAEKLYLQQGKPCGKLNWKKEFRPLIKQFRQQFRQDEGLKTTIKVIQPPLKQNTFTDSELLNVLASEISVDNLLKKFNISYKQLLDSINNLKSNGYNIHEVNGNYKLEKKIITLSENTYSNEWDGEQIIRFGALGDTHLCSKWQQLTFLHKIYDIYKKEGIDTVYHTGDISDGYNKRRANHIYELIPGMVGVEQQKNYIVTSYPRRKGIKTQFVGGNHDSWHLMNGGADIGKMIARERDDMEYLGNSSSVINLTPFCTMKLKHPGRGSSYSISYTTQKSIDAMTGGNKPNVYLVGHYHKAEYLFYRNIHCVQTGTMCGQTGWMDAMELAAHVGAWIIEIHVNDLGTITRFKSEFIPLYNIKENDF